ncbi:zf-DHHC-domain-containing protein [Martensiomyces pterosporus]|nr:zf-DHHC-domain-containing protein [Martensiomyces pterosporus]
MHSRIPIALTLAANIFTYAMACATDPGVVDSGNVDWACAQFKYDRMLYFESTCRTCHLRKPARSKHCSVCGRCVQMMDHHCIWLNNCVGLNNARWFLGFLASFSMVCVYGVYILGSAVLELRHRTGLADLMVPDEASGKMVKLLLAVLTVFVVLLAPIITLFTAYQLRIVMLGYTTNEEAKWLNVAAAIDDGVLFAVCGEDGGEMLEVVEKEDQEADSREKSPVVSLSDVVNAYDRGLWQNLRFLVFPPTHQRAKLG